MGGLAFLMRRLSGMQCQPRCSHLWTSGLQSAYCWRTLQGLRLAGVHPATAASEPVPHRVPPQGCQVPDILQILHWSRRLKVQVPELPFAKTLYRLTVWAPSPLEPPSSSLHDVFSVQHQFSLPLFPIQRDPVSPLMQVQPQHPKLGGHMW